MEGEAETADAQRAYRLPRLDVPRVIQQKVIPGKTEGGRSPCESCSEEIVSPSSRRGHLRDIGWLFQLV